MDSKYWKIGDYVKVTQLPEAQIRLEDETDDDRATLLGHIGMIMGLLSKETHSITTNLVEVGFYGGADWGDTIERKFAEEELTFVSRPMKPFTIFYHHNC